MYLDTDVAMSQVYPGNEQLHTFVYLHYQLQQLLLPYS